MEEVDLCGRSLPTSGLDGLTRSQKGFGEGDSDETSQEKLEAYFAQFGKINAVRKRRVDLEGKGPKGKGKGKFKVTQLSSAYARLTRLGVMLRRIRIRDRNEEVP